jgi:acetyl-CoA C-acetyltransferase
MPETADNLARDFSISRDDADNFAVRSHRNAAAAWAAGRFADEVVPIEVTGKRGAKTTVSTDEGIRAEADMDTMSKLKTLRPNGVCTAGNSSQQNDAAAICLLVSQDYAIRHNLAPLARLVGWSVAGCDPSRMGIGPVPAVAKLFAQTGLTLADMDLIELNEAFATQALAVLKAWHIDDIDRVNVNGSGISLGHPIGATGIRIMTTLLHELVRRKARYGLETMCIGGGQGMAAVFERI